MLSCVLIQQPFWQPLSFQRDYFVLFPLFWSGVFHAPEHAWWHCKQDHCFDQSSLVVLTCWTIQGILQLSMLTMSTATDESDGSSWIVLPRWSYPFLPLPSPCLNFTRSRSISAQSCLLSSSSNASFCDGCDRTHPSTHLPCCALTSNNRFWQPFEDCLHNGITLYCFPLFWSGFIYIPGHTWWQCKWDHCLDQSSLVVWTCWTYTGRLQIVHIDNVYSKLPQ